MDELKVLSNQFTKIVIETDEDNPVTVAEIASDLVKVEPGYRVRMTPTYT